MIAYLVASVVSSGWLKLACCAVRDLKLQVHSLSVIR